MNHLNPASTGVFAFTRKRLFQCPPLFNCNSSFRLRHDFSFIPFDTERLTSNSFSLLSVLEATFSLQLFCCSKPGNIEIIDFQGHWPYNVPEIRQYIFIRQSGKAEDGMSMKRGNRYEDQRIWIEVPAAVPGRFACLPVLLRRRVR